MKILELFSGYGTSSFALKRLGIPYECVGYSDIDKYANQCFRQNHFPNYNINDRLFKELGNVKEVKPEELEDFDLLTGGFPCQAFSNAGKMQGELDPRGTLFYEIIRIAEVKKPRWMLLENVKGLTCKKFKDTFDKILSELVRIGYKVHWKVLNSKDYGIPQSRARVWFVCFREQEDYDKFTFPEPEPLKIFIKDILEPEVNEKYYLSELAKSRLVKRCNLLERNGISGCLTANIFKVNWNTPLIEQTRASYTQFDFGNYSQQDRVYNPESISPTLATDTVSIVEPKFIDIYNKKLKEICLALTSPEYNSLRCFDGAYIRKLTPKECFRLMGFLNDEINLTGLSDTQCYKLAGNGQDINVVSKIFERMLK
jgi:DNA (cytosine-5)-methyltransferase 1